MSNFVCFFFFCSSFFFWNNNISFKNFTSSIANLVMTNSRKITFFWNFYLMNYWTYTLTDLQNLHGMIAQDCFEDAGTTHTTTFLQKKIHWIFFVRMLYTMVFWSADLLPSFSSRSWLYSNWTAAICFHLPCVLRLRSRSTNSPLLIDLWKQLSF